MAAHRVCAQPAQKREAPRVTTTKGLHARIHRFTWARRGETYKVTTSPEPNGRRVVQPAQQQYSFKRTEDSTRAGKNKQ